MRARRPLLAVLLLLPPAGASAESHKLKAAAAMSNVQGQSTLWGGRLALETAPWNKFLPKDQKPQKPPFLRPFSVITEFTVHAGAHESSATTSRAAESSTRTQYALLAGPRFTLGRGDCPHLYVHGLIGPVWTDDKMLNVKDHNFAWAWGGGIGADYIFPGTHGGLQVQVNVLRPLTSAPAFGTFAQISLGVVIKFEPAAPKPKP